jgi:hypothetical protein
MNQFLTEEMTNEFSKTIKIGLVATKDELNKPHITVLSTLMGKDNNKMVFGKFVEGNSKEFIKERIETGFLIMNTEKEFWYGKMTYSNEKKEGDEYIIYNNQPLYRYNTYFGINTVYYFDLAEISDKYVLPMPKIILNAIKVMISKHKYQGDKSKIVMKPWAEKFTAKLDTLTFISYIDKDSFPVIVPIIQAQSASSSRIVFKNEPYKELLKDLVSNQDIAILAFSMTMETVLLKGKFSGFDKSGLGYLDITRVYNCMPPVHKYIYEESSKV